MDPRLLTPAPMNTNGLTSLSPRQRSKQPIRSIPLSTINLDQAQVDQVNPNPLPLPNPTNDIQDIALLVTQWLESRSYHEAARTVEADVLGVRRGKVEISADVERALLGELPTILPASCHPIEQS